jgi:hypothetical protein
MSCGRFMRPLFLEHVGNFQRIPALFAEGEEMVADATGRYPFVVGIVHGVQRKLAASATVISFVLSDETF